MKMQQVHFAKLEAAIKGAFAKVNATAKGINPESEALTFPKVVEHYAAASKDKDPAMRARWDIFWASGGYDIFGGVREMAYMNDNHMDTALKAVMERI